MQGCQWRVLEYLYKSLHDTDLYKSLHDTDGELQISSSGEILNLYNLEIFDSTL